LFLDNFVGKDDDDNKSHRQRLVIRSCFFGVGDFQGGIRNGGVKMTGTTTAGRLATFISIDTCTICPFPSSKDSGKMFEKLGLRAEKKTETEPH